MANLELRLLELGDIENVVSIYLETFNAPPWNDGWGLEAARERLQGLIAAPQSFGVLAQVDGAPVAFALGYLERWVTATHFHLKEMCTAPNRQRTGIGTSVVQFLLATLKNRGVEQIVCETRPGSPAEAFYRRAGFGPLDLVSLAKRL